MDIVDKFWAFAKHGNQDECWIWQGVVNKDGYGRLCLDGIDVAAHRFSWSLENGPIAEGVFICHHCDNPPCVNPSHLFSGTSAENMQDMVGKGRQFRPAFSLQDKESRSKLNAQTVAEMRDMYRGGGTSFKKLGQLYGISPAAAGRAVTGVSWPDVPNIVAHQVRKGNAKLTPEAVQEIKQELARGESQTSLARRFGVSRRTIFDIKYGRFWKGVAA